MTHCPPRERRTITEGDIICQDLLSHWEIYDWEGCIIFDDPSPAESTPWQNPYHTITGPKELTSNNGAKTLPIQVFCS